MVQTFLNQACTSHRPAVGTPGLLRLLYFTKSECVHLQDVPIHPSMYLSTYLCIFVRNAPMWVKMWWIFVDFLYYFLFRFYRHYMTEKQWYKHNRLPGIAYLFELKGCVSYTYANENVGHPWGFAGRIYGGMYDRWTIKQSRRYFCVQYFV